MGVEPGNLVREGTERRAFGEYVSQRGELASYAFGWDPEDKSGYGRLTIGIGAGNPGGGTFHVRLWISEDDGWAMGLIDEPFEAVPQGGPDLTADEAREHEDLPFVWNVADAVMARDPRALWMLATLRGTSAVVTGPVRSGSEPVRTVGRDEEGEWALVCETVDLAADGHLMHLYHVIDDDPSLVEVLDLQPNEHAHREGPGQPWERFSGEP